MFFDERFKIRQPSLYLNYIWLSCLSFKFWQYYSLFFLNDSHNFFLFLNFVVMCLSEYHSLLKDWSFWNLLVSFWQIRSGNIRKIYWSVSYFLRRFLFSRDVVRFNFFLNRNLFWWRRRVRIYFYLLFETLFLVSNLFLLDNFWLIRRLWNFSFLYCNLFGLDNFLLRRWLFANFFLLLSILIFCRKRLYSFLF